MFLLFQRLVYGPEFLLNFLFVFEFRLDDVILYLTVYYLEGNPVLVLVLVQFLFSALLDMLSDQWIGVIY